MRTSSYNRSFFSLVFLSLVTGFIMLALFAKTAPLFVAKVIYYCRQFISSNTFFKIPQSLLGIPIFLLGLVLLLGLLSFLLQIYKTQLLLKKLFQKRVALSLKLAKAAIAVNLNNKITLVKDNNLFSFCYGLLIPKILITTSLVSSLSDKELEAVLLHEKAHLLARDPFKIILGKAISSMFFFLPIFSELNNKMNVTNEILADYYAAKSQHKVTYLKNALKKILSTPQVKLAAVPAISNPDYLEIRIKRLLSSTTKYKSSLSRISLLTSLLFFVFSWFLLQTQVHAFQIKSETSTSYFLCSPDKACEEKCQMNASLSSFTTEQELFSSQTPKYELPSIK